MRVINRMQYYHCNVIKQNKSISVIYIAQIKLELEFNNAYIINILELHELQFV
ncbi:hypothetical protein TorRG33x02_156380 [Trema orientale]|uniref:Uncharacterized protein n=1 Tax=Trema orientale TaxID=63057 RepID=A0A2P5ESQ8_TREOI|nr:hypothetical protein TorRG33x02_156380 [Trema orientale]